MRNWHSRWSDLLAPLGQAGLDLARAEYGVVATEVRNSGKTLVKALVLLLAGLFALFWSIGAIAIVVVEVGALWLPRWGAALGSFVIFVLVGLIFAAVARRRLRSIEHPTETVRRRVNEHRDWWDRKVTAVGPSGRYRQPLGDPSDSATRHAEPSDLPPESSDDAR